MGKIRLVKEVRRFGEVLYASDLTSIVRIDTKAAYAAKIRVVKGTIDVRESSKGVIAMLLNRRTN